jgi:uncharacterized protein YegP (UPF0339 family)
LPREACRRALPRTCDVENPSADTASRNTPGASDERPVRSQQDQQRQVHVQPEGRQRDRRADQSAYEAKAGALQGIESVRVNAALGERFERLNSTQESPYFTLKAANGQVIGRSQMYASLASMETGIASVAKNAPGAPTVDLTL